jgi:hypothetical protein
MGVKFGLWHIDRSRYIDSVREKVQSRIYEAMRIDDRENYITRCFIICSSQNTKMLKSRSLRWTKICNTYCRDVNSCKIVVEKPEGMRPLGDLVVDGV